MGNRKFNPEKLDKLNNPERLTIIPPQHILEFLDLSQESTIVDIGAGTGLFSRVFSEYLINGRVYACDISDLMVDWMKNSLSDRYPEVIPVLMEENKVPLASGIADLVLMINLHHELENPEVILKESFRIIKKNGKICIIDWKKEKTGSGPPANIRVTTKEVVNQLITSGFTNPLIDESMINNFMVTAEKI